MGGEGDGTASVNSDHVRLEFQAKFRRGGT